jgi:pyruvate dehydrogenase E1 component beta subunit
MTFSAATLEAMQEEMQRDPSVFLMGEDIAKQGGIFGQFKNLPTQFGLDRVRDTPISEAAIVAAAVGAAMTGSRPVVDIHFADFLTCAMDELINQAAKMRYMFGGQVAVPLVIRAPEGAVRSAGPQHSQCLESWFVNTPGWRVVSPSNPADAKGLLKMAIRSNDPVLYLEHKALFSRKGEVPAGDHTVQLGKARIAKHGSDVTVISWSLTLNKCLDAAGQVGDEGVDCEVVDMRTLSPLDMETVLESVSRTRRAVVVHEAPRTAGVGAEIAARISEELFGVLLAPVGRLANPDVPIPFAPNLEARAIPQVADIAACIRELAAA